MCSATLRRWSTPEMVDPQLDGPQLAALAAVVELGSFDAAADRSPITKLEREQILGYDPATGV